MTVPAAASPAETSEPTGTLGEQLDVINADMDAAYTAIRDAGYPHTGPEQDALEAVYVRLRAWNVRAAHRTGFPASHL